MRSLRADVVALEVASGDAEQKVQVAEEAAAAARQQLQEAEEQVHTLALAYNAVMIQGCSMLLAACVTLEGHVGTAKT